MTLKFDYLDSNVPVKMDHVAAINVIYNCSISVSVGVALCMMTRDVIEVNVIGKVQQQIVTTCWVN